MKGVTKYTYDGLDVIQDNDSATGITKYQNGLGIDNKLKLDNGSDVNYFLADHLGSTNGLADTSGNLTSSTSYDSFGNPTSNLNTRYQFTGREKDDVTELYYYRARQYDSKLGRFVSEDPIGFAGGDINLYGYVWNNPQMLTDPSGLFPHFTGPFIGVPALTAQFAGYFESSSKTSPKINITQHPLNINDSINGKYGSIGQQTDIIVSSQGKDANKAYAIVQWAKGYAKINGDFCKTPYLGKTRNSNDSDCVLDSRDPSPFYPTEPYKNKMTASDTPGWNSTIPGYRYEMDQDFKTCAYNKGDVSGLSASDFINPSNPKPVACKDWSVKIPKTTAR